MREAGQRYRGDRGERLTRRPSPSRGGRAAPEEAERAGGPTCGSGGGMAGMELGEQTEPRGGGAAVTDPRGVLRQGRAFLDFFWDIAKPEQEVRLAATESLLRHLREGKKVRRGPVVRAGSGSSHGSSLRSRLGSADGARAGRGGLAAGPRSEQPGHRPGRSVLQDDELKYTLKRLVEGLGATREAARPGFSLALAQVSVSQRGSEPSAPLSMLGVSFAVCAKLEDSLLCTWEGRFLQ